MKFFRGIIAVLFLGLIVFGLWQWRSLDTDVPQTNLVAQIQAKRNNFYDKYFATDGTNNSNNNNQDNNTTQPRLHEDVTTGTLSLEAFNNLTENTVSTGPIGSNYALLIWCDFDAVFCKQLYEEGKPTDYQVASIDSLEIYFKGYTTAFNGPESTYNTQHAWLCAEKLANAPQRTALRMNLFRNPYQSIEDLVEKGEQLGISGFAGCLLTEDSEQQLKQQNLQAKNLFSIKSLPSLVFYKKDTGQWFLVPGYYSNKELESTLDVIFSD